MPWLGSTKAAHSEGACALTFLGVIFAAEHSPSSSLTWQPWQLLGSGRTLEMYRFWESSGNGERQSPKLRAWSLAWGKMGPLQPGGVGHTQREYLGKSLQARGAGSGCPGSGGVSELVCADGVACELWDPWFFWLDSFAVDDPEGDAPWWQDRVVKAQRLNRAGQIRKSTWAAAGRSSLWDAFHDVVRGIPSSVAYCRPVSGTRGSVGSVPRRTVRLRAPDYTVGCCPPPDSFEIHECI